MPEPYGQLGRVLAGCLLLTLLAGCLVLAGATTGDLTETAYPNEADVNGDREAYVGQEVVIGGFVVDTDPVVVATLASGDGRYTLVDADRHLRNGDEPLERDDRVNAFGTLEDESTLVVERAMTRESTENRYMVVVSALGGLWVAGRFLVHWRVDPSALAFVPRARSITALLERDGDSRRPHDDDSRRTRDSRRDRRTDAEREGRTGDPQGADERSATEGGDRRA